MTDPVVEAVREKLRVRSTAGIKKYKTTLATNHASLRDRVVHLQEELMDAANYCEWILQRIDGEN